MAYSETERQYLFEEALERVEAGESLKNIFDGENAVLSRTLFYKQLQSEENKEKYARSMEIRADRMFDDLVEIADNEERDFTENVFGDRIPNNAAIQRDRLKVDTRKWILARMAPKKYGDKLELDNKHSGNISINLSPEDAALGE